MTFPGIIANQIMVWLNLEYEAHLDPIILLRYAVCRM